MKIFIVLGLSLLTSPGLVPTTEAHLPRFPENISKTIEVDHMKVDSDRIVGGMAAEPCQFPYQVSVRRKGAGGSSHFCGGSLLTDSIVICAGHCAQGQQAANIEIVAGTISLAQGGVHRNVKAIKLHEKYNAQTVDNDISLFYLQNAFQLNDCSIGTVTLPVKADGELLPNTALIVSGWGTTTEGGNAVSTELRFVEVRSISPSDCDKAYGEGEITSNMVCAGVEDGGKDSCQGDSGGPLVEKETGNLIGIVSWGYGCARPEYPGVYTKVVNYLDWISENTASRSRHNRNIKK